MALSPTDPRTGRPAGGLLVVGVEQGSAAAEAGIRKGDVIMEVNQRQVSSAEEVASIVAKEGKAHGAVLGAGSSARDSPCSGPSPCNKTVSHAWR